jgi:hypothetical protein
MMIDFAAKPTWAAKSSQFIVLQQTSCLDEAEAIQSHSESLTTKRAYRYALETITTDRWVLGMVLLGLILNKSFEHAYRAHIRRKSAVNTSLSLQPIRTKFYENEFVDLGEWDAHEAAQKQL